jgi:hypothetical protein
MDWTYRASGSKVVENPYNRGVATKEEVKRLNAWISSNSNIYTPTYVKFYHGTGRNIPILEEGLKVTTETRRRSFMSSSGYVYLACTPDKAKVFGDLGNQSNSVVYEVIVRVVDLSPDLDAIRLKREFEPEIKNSLAHSIAFCGVVRVAKSIPIWQIQKYEESCE